MVLKEALNIVLPRYVPFLPEGVEVDGRVVPSFRPWDYIVSRFEIREYNIGLVHDFMSRVLNISSLSLVLQDLYTKYHHVYFVPARYLTFEVVSVLERPDAPESFEKFWMEAVKKEKWKKWRGAARVYGVLFSNQLRRLEMRFKTKRKEVFKVGLRGFLHALLMPEGLCGGTYFYFAGLESPVVIRVLAGFNEAVDWLVRSLHIGFPDPRRGFRGALKPSLLEAVEDVLG